MDAPQTPAPPAEQKPAGGNPPLDLSRVQKKRGRGRPRKPVFQKAADAANAQKHSEASPADAALNAAFLSESACCLIEIVDEVISRNLAHRIGKAMPDKLEEFVKMQAEVGFNDKDREMVGMSVDALAKKYSILTKFGPEIFLGAWAIQYAVRQRQLFAFVNDLAAAREKLLEGQRQQNVTPFPAPAAARN